MAKLRESAVPADPGFTGEVGQDTHIGSTGERLSHAPDVGLESSKMFVKI